MVVPFGRMVINLSSADMQSKANEYDQFINSNQKPMEFLISEMGDWIRRSVSPIDRAWLSEGRLGSQVRMNFCKNSERGGGGSKIVWSFSANLSKFENSNVLKFV